MKQFKLSSKRQSSGQVIVLLIIVLALLGGAWWWLNSNKENAVREGTAFARDAVQKIAVQHDINFFNSRLSPQARMNFPASTQAGVHERDCEARGAGPAGRRSGQD